jgi:hypothetical protein
MVRVIIIPIREPGVTGVSRCEVRKFSDPYDAARVYGHYVGISNVRAYLVQGRGFGYEIVASSD